MFCSLYPIHPTVNVVSFFQPVGRQLAAAIAVRTRVGKQNHIVILHKPLPVTVHSHPVVRDTVQQNDGIAVWLGWTHEPGIQDGAIWTRKFHIAEFHLIFLRSGSRVALFAGSYRMTGRVQRSPTQTNAAENCPRNVENDYEHNKTL